MKDISYQILDLLEKYGSDPEGIKKALEQEDTPEVLYALSPVRENLLEWYDWNPEGRLLQIGADYGALTGMLAERLRQVDVWDCLDEDLEVVKRRFPQTEGIHLLKQLPLEKLEQECYDYIFIPELRMDLLPESGNREHAEAGTVSLLTRLKLLLKPEGKLILAGFNRIGLRRFAGAEADEGTAAITWRLIGEMTERCMDGHAPAVYYPVPDHRLPTAVYSDKRLPEKGELSNLSVAYDKPGFRYFSEEAGFDELLQEGQFPQFADSYLVIWEK